MIKSHVEFLVDWSVTGESQRLSVYGRTGNNPVRVGQRFDYVYSYKPRAFPHGLEKPAEIDQVLPVSLTVEAIRACDRDLTELPRGWTGMLVFDVGRPDYLLPDGWALGSHDPRIVERQAAPAESKVG